MITRANPPTTIPIIAPVPRPLETLIVSVGGDVRVVVCQMEIVAVSDWGSVVGVNV
jgi:hypothetical protein